VQAESATALRLVPPLTDGGLDVQSIAVSVAVKDGAADHPSSPPITAVAAEVDSTSSSPTSTTAAYCRAVELTQLAVAITSKQLGSAAHPVARPCPSLSPVCRVRVGLG
jgi:hypothetical protein